MKIKCDKCNNILKEKGGLAFSPPNPGGQVDKIHLCVYCWGEFVKEFIQEGG